MAASPRTLVIFIEISLQRSDRHASAKRPTQLAAHHGAGRKLVESDINLEVISPCAGGINARRTFQFHSPYKNLSCHTQRQTHVICGTITVPLGRCSWT